MRPWEQPDTSLAREPGILVADRWQRRGIGTRLLRGVIGPGGRGKWGIATATIPLLSGGSR